MAIGHTPFEHPHLTGLAGDVAFTVGQPETRQVALTLFFAPIQGKCYDEIWANSTTPGVFIDSPCYGCSGSPPPIGSEPATVVGNLGDSGPYGFNHTFTMVIRYDGSGSGAAHGEIRLYADDTECGWASPDALRPIGSVNVHILDRMSYWPETTFQVGSDARVANFFYIDHPLLNGRPDARLFVTPVAGSYSAYSGNVVGVWYSHSSGQWSVYNESGTSMSGGQLFNVSLGGYEGQRSMRDQLAARRGLRPPPREGAG